MEFRRRDLQRSTSDDEALREDRGADEITQFSVIVTASPPVSPSVVAAILMIQKPSVTSGTLLKLRSWRVGMPN